MPIRWSRKADVSTADLTRARNEWHCDFVQLPHICPHSPVIRLIFFFIVMQYYGAVTSPVLWLHESQIGTAKQTSITEGALISSLVLSASCQPPFLHTDSRVLPPLHVLCACRVTALAYPCIRTLRKVLWPLDCFACNKVWVEFLPPFEWHTGEQKSEAKMPLHWPSYLKSF